MSRHALLSVSAMAAILLWGSAAWAHPLVDKGRTLLQQADFQGALHALADAEASTDLSRADYVKLLETRALVHQALGDDAGVDHDLSALASVDPNHTFGAEVPPDITGRFATLRSRSPGPLGVVVDVTAESGGVTLEGHVQNDSLGLARHVVIHGRVGNHPFEQAQDQPLTLLAGNGRSVTFWADVIGPGGAVIAHEGTEASPRLRDFGPSPVAAAPAVHHSSSPWLWIGIGAGVVVVATVVIVAVAASSGGGPVTTQVNGPNGPF